MFASQHERRYGPRLAEIKPVKLPLIETGHLHNQIPYHLINLGSHPVCRIDIVFQAGRPFERRPASSRTTTSLLREGAGDRSSAQIAETLDFYGGSLKCSAGLDFTIISLFSLTKHLNQLLPLMADVVLRPRFPDSEIEDFKVLNARQLRQELHKTDVVAYRLITEMIFGREHPYGYNTSPEDYLAITRDDITQHYERCFRPGNARVFISGRISPGILEMVNQYFGQASPSQSFEKARLPEVPLKPETRFERFPKAEQSSLRMGFAFGNRNHPDYTDLYFASTILGGYFGSRLMKNIREEKGYTYNIYAQVDPHLYHGSCYISSEVGNEYVQKTIDEIRLELLKMSEQLVSSEELIMVKNYLLGQLHNMIDGPFNLASVVRALVLETGSLDFFDCFTRRIADITTEEIRAVSARYFSPDQMHLCVVGPASS